MPRTILRAVFMVLFAITGFLLGRESFTHLISLHVANQSWLLALTILAPVCGALVGLFLAPAAVSLFEVELDAVEGALERLSAEEISGGALGLIAGLVVAFMLKSALFEVIANAGPAAGYVADAGYVLLGIFAAFLGVRVGAKRLRPASAGASVGGSHVLEKIIDTSVIVDGRVLGLLETGFLEGPLLLPRFVLRELHLIADSTDPAKRTRGRRGLEVLAKIAESSAFEIVERDYDDLREVDAKLVRLALERGAKLVTNDYNLNRVAHVEGVVVLNVNEVAGAVKPVVLPGEELHVTIVRDGKEPHQGVGYLEDGTMIVVENGRRLIGEETDIVVTSVLQTVAGRMIFARPKRAQGAAAS